VQEACYVDGGGRVQSDIEVEAVETKQRADIRARGMIFKDLVVSHARLNVMCCCRPRKRLQKPLTWMEVKGCNQQWRLAFWKQAETSISSGSVASEQQQESRSSSAAPKDELQESSDEQLQAAIQQLRAQKENSDHKQSEGSGGL